MVDTPIVQAFTYREKIDSAIRDLLLEFECQPILFVGSGLSRRYFSGPNWLELLRLVYSKISDDPSGFDYLCQKYSGNPILIGAALADDAFEWAWTAGKNEFPVEFFVGNLHKDAFIKHLCCQIIKEITPSPSETDSKHKKELAALAAIRPHAVITTNYDLFLEGVFQGYDTITGQTILRYNTNSFGEIFHIHGDVSDPTSLVLTATDYDEWNQKKKYVSAKLLTYFAEHPVFLFGYGIGDPNVKAILRDIGELVASTEGIIPNVYQVIWQKDQVLDHPPEYVNLAVDGNDYLIKAVYTNELEWVFNALKSQSALNSINLKLVRALAARTMKLIRHDIPSGSVQVDYDILERVAEVNDELPKLLGIASIGNANQSHPLTISQVATRLGLNHWSHALKLIQKIKIDKGVDLKASDNKYHCKIKTGAGKHSIARKWSLATVDLLRKVQNGEPYDVTI